MRHREHGEDFLWCGIEATFRAGALVERQFDGDAGRTGLREISNSSQQDVGSEGM